MAARASPGRRSRSASPRPSMKDQLEQAISLRNSRRSTSEALVPADAPHPSCAFCGLVADRNVVRCTGCDAAYHVRCLSTSQAARHKGRRWRCDECVRSAPDV